MGADKFGELALETKRMFRLHQSTVTSVLDTGKRGC